jgi:hypothetical protein
MGDGIFWDVLWERDGRRDQDQAHREETLAIFIETGRSEVEHDIWRQRVLTELLFVSAKREDEFRRSAGEKELKRYSELKLGQDGERPRRESLMPAAASRAEHERIAARWFTQNQGKHNLDLRSADIAELSRRAFALDYDCGIFNARESIRNLANECRRHSSTEEASKRTRKGNLPEPTWIELEDEDLDAHDVVRWLQMDKTSTKTNSQRHEEINVQDLQKAANRALESLPRTPHRLENPARIQKRQDSLFHQFAIVARGRSGAGGGHTYRRVKDPLKIEETKESDES